MKTALLKSSLLVFFFVSMTVSAQVKVDLTDEIPYCIYPDLNNDMPDLASPFLASSGEEYVVAVTKNGKFAIVQVSLSNARAICQQLIVDDLDFPELASTGLHSMERLGDTWNITGRSLEEITLLGRPNGLSKEGFLAEDEDVLAVIWNDNITVGQMGLSHPQLCKPLFHILNMIDFDLDLNRWNMAKHEWENITHFYYNGKKINIKAFDTKGGQKSIFDDDLEGSFCIELTRDYTAMEMSFLETHYGFLSHEMKAEFKKRLGTIMTGELEPQYIQRYGFYEGHTEWRTDPIALSFMFGLQSLEELEAIFPGELFERLTTHFIEIGWK